MKVEATVIVSVPASEVQRLVAEYLSQQLGLTIEADRISINIEEDSYGNHYLNNLTVDLTLNEIREAKNIS